MRCTETLDRLVVVSCPPHHLPAVGEGFHQKGVLPIMPGSRGVAPHFAALSSVADAPRRLPPLPIGGRRPRRLDEHTSVPRRQQCGPPSRESAAGRSLQETTVLWPPMEGMATAQFWQLRRLRLSHLCVKLAGVVPFAHCTFAGRKPVPAWKYSSTTARITGKGTALIRSKKVGHDGSDITLGSRWGGSGFKDTQGWYATS